MIVYYEISTYSHKSDKVASIVFRLVDMNLVNKEKSFFKNKTIDFWYNILSMSKLYANFIGYIYFLFIFKAHLVILVISSL